MDRRPTRRDAGIVSRGMLERIIVSGAFIAVVFMAQSWTNFMGGTAEQQSTILFTLFVVFQLFNAFNSRELGNASLFANLLRNKVMIGVFALMFALQVLVVQFGGAMFRTVPLPIDMWLKSSRSVSAWWCCRKLSRPSSAQPPPSARAARPMKAIPSNRTSQSLWIWWTDNTPITERDRQIPVGLFSFAVGQMRG